MAQHTKFQVSEFITVAAAEHMRFLVLGNISIDNHNAAWVYSVEVKNAWFQR